MEDSEAGEAELRAIVQRQTETLETLLALPPWKRSAVGRRWLSFGLALALICGAIGGVAYASAPSAPDGLIHGCYPKGGGTLSILDPAKGPPTCGANAAALSWNRNGTPRHLQEIADASTPTHLVVPANVTTLSFELWGGGGAGGADVTCDPKVGPKWGGPGGSGAYIRALFSVTPGETLTVTIGAAGAGGAGNGGAGGDTAIARGATILATAGGGAGGEVAGGTQGCATGGYYGRPGAGGTPSTSASNAIQWPGNKSPYDSSHPYGAAAVQGSVELPGGASRGGDGTHSSGMNGGAGYAIVSW